MRKWSFLAATVVLLVAASPAGGPTDPGDTVVIAAGTYDVTAAEIDVATQITVVGSVFGERPVITGSDPNTTTFKVSPGASGSTISFLDIRATGFGGRAFSADVAVT